MSGAFKSAAGPQPTLGEPLQSTIAAAVLFLHLHVSETLWIEVEPNLRRLDA